MKKFKSVIITIALIAVAATAAVLIIYNYFYDENKLSIKEREWISENQSNVIDINIPNKLNIFGYNGAGVFFDFVEGIEDEYSLKFNKVAIENNISANSIGFYMDKEITARDLIMYEDYYVVISKTNDVINTYEDLAGSSVGTLVSDLSRITDSHKTSATYITYETKEELLFSFKEDDVKYIIIPKTEYLDTIIEENYTIVFHLEDLEINYFLRLGENEVLNSIVLKYYNRWMKESYEETFYDYQYNLFTTKLHLTQVEIETLTNKDYIYGFTEKTPYKTVSGSNYGGITVKYLEYFTKLTQVEFNLKRYKKPETLIKDFNSGKVDLIFADTNLDLNQKEIYTSLSNQYYIVAPLDMKLNISNLKDLKTEVVAMDNSKLSKYLTTYPELNVKRVATENKLIKEANKGSVIIIDSNMYDFFVNRKINDYTIKARGFTNSNHSFQYQNDTDAMYKMFKSYVNTLSDSEMRREGLSSYYISDKSSNRVITIAKYILMTITLVSAALLYRLYTKNKIKLDTRIRKDEKLKFIDLLTSLKNRNYLTEKTDVWNNNTIYPQAIIVIDLNNVKHLNDTFGHTEGDKQIKAAANILIKSQPDNTEIMRTDGNEFMVYLVGHSEKQVLNYIKKIVKEFKKLPYEYGAAVGFSMIVDDLKLIDDAINEATIQMRENKENLVNSYEETN